MANRLTVADAAVALHADWAAFQRDVQTQGVPQAKTAGQKISAALGPTGITKAFTAAGAAGGALFVGAIGGAVNFEDQLRTINTVAHLTDDELKGVGASILDLSKETGKSTDDLTAGFYDLVSAGVPAKDAINVLRDSAKLATGALGTTGEAVDLVTSAMNAYGLKAGDSTRITDIFAQAVADGKVTAAELGQSIASIAPLAASTGVKLEEVSAAAAIMTAKGASAGEAFTNMRQAISALITPNETLLEIQKRTGVAFADVAREKGLAVALEELRVATNGNTEEFGKALGSTQAYQFALASTGENAAAYATELEKVTAAANEGGVAQGQYAERMKSAKSQGDRWLASLRAIAIEIGGPFTVVLGPAVSLLGSMGNGLFGIFRISQLVGGAIGALIGRLVGQAVATEAVGVASVTAAPGVGILGTAVNFLLGPIGLVVVAVGAFALAWSTNFLGIRDIVGGAVNFISEHLGFLLGPIKVVGEAIGNLFGFIGNLVGTVANAISETADAGVKAAHDAHAQIAAELEQLTPEATKAGQDAMQGMSDGMMREEGRFTGAVGAVVDKVPEIVAAVGPKVAAAGADVMLDLAGGLRKKRSDIDSAMDQLSSDIENRLSKTAERAKLIGLLTGKKLADALKDKDPVVKAQAEATRQLIEDQLNELIPSSGKIGKAQQDALRKAMHSKDPEVRAQAKRTQEMIDERLRATKAKEAGEAVQAKLKGGLKDKQAATVAQAQRVATAVGNVLRQVGNLFNGTGHVTIAVSGMGGKKFQFAGGSPYIPYTQVALVHEGERILTAKENAAINAGRAVLGAPEATLGHGGGDTNIYVTMDGLVEAKDPLAIATQLQRFARTGAFTPPPAPRTA